MESLKVLLEKQPRKYLDRLPEPTRGKVAAAVEKLEYLSGDIAPLRGREKRKLFRLKIYHYRVIFEFDIKNKIVRIIEINTRGDIY